MPSRLAGLRVVTLVPQLGLLDSPWGSSYVAWGGPASSSTSSLWAASCSSKPAETCERGSPPAGSVPGWDQDAKLGSGSAEAARHHGGHFCQQPAGRSRSACSTAAPRAHPLLSTGAGELQRGFSTSHGAAWPCWKWSSAWRWCTAASELGTLHRCCAHGQRAQFPSESNRPRHWSQGR